MWRQVDQVTLSLAPGSGIEARIIAERSGMTEYFGLDGEGSPAWLEYGVNGRLRITIDYDNGTNTDTATAEVALEPSPNDDGAEPTAAGASWGYLLFKHIPIIAPAAVKAGTPADLAKWSENTSITITIEHQGGARVIQCAVSEIPALHVVAHDEETDVSIHGWPPDLQPLARPQTEAQDGADFEEHRQGTNRARIVAFRQSQELGPVIASATPYTETTAAIDDTEIAPWVVTSTTFVGLSIGSSITSWSSDGPGYAVAGYYALRNPENLSTRLSGAATIPVRIRVRARFSAAGSNTGTIRWQSTDRSWVEIKVSQATVGDTWTDLTITGFLESMVAPDDRYPNLQDFAKTTGGTLEIGPWSVEWGDKAVAA